MAADPPHRVTRLGLRDTSGHESQARPAEDVLLRRVIGSLGSRLGPFVGYLIPPPLMGGCPFHNHRGFSHLSIFFKSRSEQLLGLFRYLAPPLAPDLPPPPHLLAPVA